MLAGRPTPADQVQKCVSLQTFQILLLSFTCVSATGAQRANSYDGREYTVEDIRTYGRTVRSLKNVNTLNDGNYKCGDGVYQKREKSDIEMPCMAYMAILLPNHLIFFFKR